MTNPSTKYHYTLSAEQQTRFADIYLLRRMINQPLAVSVDLSGDDSFLESTLGRLVSKGWVTIEKSKALYVPTQAGRDPLQKFEQRYYDYLKVYEVYCAVDLEKGEFGYNYMDDFAAKMNTIRLFRQDHWKPYISKFQEYLAAANWKSVAPAAFRTFLSLDIWEDLRVAVAESKQLDPMEIVYMSLLNEGAFDQTERSWQFDLHSGWFFQKIEKIANSAVHLDQLIADDCTPEEVMENILTAGTDAMLGRIAREEAFAEEEAADRAKLAKQQAAKTQTTVTTTTEVIAEVSYVTVVEPVYHHYSYYYDAYRADPYYVAPIWYDPWYW